MDEIVVDPDRQKKAKEYAIISRRLFVVELAIGLLYILAWLIFEWAISLRNFILEWTNNPWWIVILFAACFGCIYYLVGLPINYYQSYVLPHRYEMSTQNVKRWIIDEVKSLIIGGFLVGLVIEMIYAVLRIAPNTWWLWAAGLLLVFNVLLANLAPVLLFPIFYKFKPLDEEQNDLEQRLVQLAKRTNTDVRGVFKFDMSSRTKAANAALTGLGNTRRIIVGDTLISEFNVDEIESIMAHELGHHVHKDIPLGILIQSVLTMSGLYVASVFLRLGVGILGMEGLADIAGLPVFLLAIGLFGLITMPLGNAFSRWRERRADQFALEMTGNGHVYATALKRLANQNLAETDPDPWVVFLLNSHPPLNQRIAFAEMWKKGEAS